MDKVEDFHVEHCIAGVRCRLEKIILSPAELSEKFFDAAEDLKGRHIFDDALVSIACLVCKDSSTRLALRVLVTYVYKNPSGIPLKVSVLYVDSGHTGDVNVDCVPTVDAEAAAKPKTAILCCIRNVKPTAESSRYDLKRLCKRGARSLVCYAASDAGVNEVDLLARPLVGRPSLDDEEDGAQRRTLRTAGPPPRRGRGRAEPRPGGGLPGRPPAGSGQSGTMLEPGDQAAVFPVKCEWGSTGGGLRWLRPHSTPATLLWYTRARLLIRLFGGGLSAVATRSNAGCRRTTRGGDSDAGRSPTQFPAQIIRQQFPQLTTRRLGTRGQSRYHYYGIAVRIGSRYFEPPYGKGRPARSASRRRCSSSSTRAGGPCRCCRSSPRVRELLLPAGADGEQLHGFVAMYRGHCQRLLDECAAARGQPPVQAGVLQYVAHFWRRVPAHLAPLLASNALANLVGVCDSLLYGALADALLPQPPMADDEPDSHVCRGARLLSEQLVSWLDAALAGFPAPLRAVKLHMGRCLSQALRRRLALAKLAQAWRGAAGAACRDWALLDLAALSREAAAHSPGTPSARFLYARAQELSLLLEAPAEALLGWLEALVEAHRERPQRGGRPRGAPGAPLPGRVGRRGRGGRAPARLGRQPAAAPAAPPAGRVGAPAAREAAGRRPGQAAARKRGQRRAAGPNRLARVRRCPSARAWCIHVTSQHTASASNSRRCKLIDGHHRPAPLSAPHRRRLRTLVLPQQCPQPPVRSNTPRRRPLPKGIERAHWTERCQLHCYHVQAQAVDLTVQASTPCFNIPVSQLPACSRSSAAHDSYPLAHHSAENTNLFYAPGCCRIS
ncbi:hypothetical protein HPB48_025309 [Haemaphysalis longicornis]|uniref:Uncharacterized protein n=1 Tax=Haemaphysalis longicornis TaxID=44386 RepID=A0A9J6H9M9_HAELO|nr:hypothetical protein HPB48_025309 [Haemaphysalis longicornis]